MISVSKPKENEYEKIKEICLEKGMKLKKEENLLVVSDGKDIIGFGSYVAENNIAFLEKLEILEDNMLLNDMLLKSLFNLADLEACRYFAICKSEIEPYYQNINFKEKDETVTIPDSYMYVDLIEFFSGKCGCSCKK